MGERGPTDEEIRLQLIVLRCQAGDEGAFVQLFERFSSRTLAYLRRLLADQAEDVQQDVWVTVYRELRTLHQPRAFRTWLFRTTRQRAIDFLRSRRRERELLQDIADSVAETLPARNPALPTLDESDLGAMVAQLSTAQREVLLLRYQEDMSYEDIAMLTGCSVGTVRSRLHYAKRRLQELLSVET
jgi:RNA polymerase sigma-70 factor (ECF subfamily)